MSALMQWNEEGYVRPMVKDGTRPEGECRQTSIRFLAGEGITDASGQWQLSVADAVCEQVGLVGVVSFVATTTFNPDIDSIPDPSFVTTASTASGGFVTLYARTWDCRCKPKPHTPFDYHAAISYDFVG